MELEYFPMNFTVSSTWKFQDENEYLVTFSCSDQPTLISCILVDKNTAEEWRNQFDLKYIENLTTRTGNYKPFRTFVAMMKSAILKKSDSVTLELMSYDDLLLLRNEKKRNSNKGPKIAETPDIRSPDPGQGLLSPHYRTEPVSPVLSQYKSDNASTKYLIVVYVAEFDKVYYPLPLKYSAFPDVQTMASTMHKLRDEVDQMKQTNTDLVRHLKAIMKGKVPVEKTEGTESPKPSRARWNLYEELGMSSKDETEGSDGGGSVSSVDVKKREKLLRSRSGHFQLGQSESVTSMVVQLRQQIAEERFNQKERILKLESENLYLRNKLQAMQASEVVLQQKISALESTAGQKPLGRKFPDPGKLIEALDKSYAEEIAKRKADKSNFKMSSQPKKRSRTAELGRSKSASANPRVVKTASSNSSVGSASGYEEPVSKSRHRNSRKPKAVTSAVTPGGSSTKVNRNKIFPSSTSLKTEIFDPTEYIRQKKLKHDLQVQLRMAQVERKIRHTSPKPEHRVDRERSGTNTRSENIKSTAAKTRSRSKPRSRSAKGKDSIDAEINNISKVLNRSPDKLALYNGEYLPWKPQRLSSSILYQGSSLSFISSNSVKGRGLGISRSQTSNRKVVKQPKSATNTNVEIPFQHSHKAGLGRAYSKYHNRLHAVHNYLGAQRNQSYKS